MEIWRTLWCFYNSIAFNAVTALVLLGGIGMVISILITLPKQPETELGKYHGPNIRFKKARQKTIILGAVTIVILLIPPILYWLLLAEMGGETCDVKVTPTGPIYLYLIALYSFTLIALVLLGFFYISSQDTKEKYDVFKK
jgi:hypothetical protein